MAEEIAFENGRIYNFEGLVTLTLTFDRIILHTDVHHSSTSTHTPNFIKVEETSCGRTDGKTFETGFIRSTLNFGVFLLRLTVSPSVHLQLCRAGCWYSRSFRASVAVLLEAHEIDTFPGRGLALYTVYTAFSTLGKWVLCPNCCTYAAVIIIWYNILDLRL